MDVGGWLRSLGLEQYEAAFRDSEIDADVLPELTDQHLKDLGVSLGHRLRLLRAIRELARDAPVIAQPAASIVRKPQDDAERRQLTVMFCDLVGSTALSARFDPEDLRGIIGAYDRCCAEGIERSGGFVAKYMGDGVLAYFGYPQAHEDDAERAVQAGLAIVEAMPKLVTAAGSTLHVRIGIATGVVVVGDLIGSGEAQERGIVGETPNLAARLQSLAEPNMVVIAEGTRKLLGNLFELQDLGPKDLRGIASPTRAWAALRVSSVETRFEALHANGLTALVGRLEETELLLRCWSKAKSGEGQVVLLSGEGGIGKSRLTVALLERLAAEPHTRLRYFCSPQHTDSAFYPIIGQMERAARLARDDAPQARLDKLNALLAQTSTSMQDAVLFAEMLSLPNDGRYPTLDLAPQQRRQRTLEALDLQVGVLSSQNPLLMIFEDAHWSDPTSLEALSRVVDRICALRALLIVTFRPEFNPPWIERAHVTAVTINRLAQREVDAMIDRVAANKLILTSIRQDIIERTDGIPLFVEEMTKAVLEAEGEGDVRRTAAAIPSPAPAVPASLHASLMSRLDRLGPAKEIAQIGAAIGREFSHALLAAVACKPTEELRLALNRLLEVGLLYRQGEQSQITYLFKHALVRDAAYGTLLREQRRSLHARIAETLETVFLEIAENQPELLARHCAEAALIEKAATLWGKAGQRSLLRSALVEAVAQLIRALDLMTTLAGTPTLRREEIKLQVAVITPLLHTKGYAAPETKAAAERARQLIEKAEGLGEPQEDPLLLFSVLYSFWVSNYAAFNGTALRELASQFPTLAKKQGARAPVMLGHRLMGASLLFTGDLADGRAHFDKAISLYDPVEHGALATRFGQDTRVTILSWRSLALWLLGYPDLALADTAHAADDARNLDQAATLIYALVLGSMIQIHCGSYAAATTQLDEAVALADARGAVLLKAAGICLQGCILVLTGRASGAVELMISGLTSWRSTGATLFVPLYLLHLARAYADLGQLEDAWRCIREAMTVVKTTTKETVFEAEVNRTAGVIALFSPQPDAAKAEVYLERALAVARKQRAKSLELRAATSLARLWRDQGKRSEAHDLLAPVYGWFIEGFDTLDLKEAKALLEEFTS